MKLEVFFDYACPYCYKGYQLLNELLAEYPGFEVEWLPCEAHPRPETHGLHSDLCARGMYLAQAQGIDLMQYHEIMYRACIIDHVNIEDPDVIADLISPLADRSVFRHGLLDKSFQDRLDQNNNNAWNPEEFPAVPSLKMAGKTLPAIPGTGLAREDIKQFLQRS